MRRIIRKIVGKYIPELTLVTAQLEIIERLQSQVEQRDEQIFAQTDIIESLQGQIEQLDEQVQTQLNYFKRLDLDNPAYISALEHNLKRQESLFEDACTMLRGLRHVDVGHIDKNINNLRLRISDLEQRISQ